MATERPTKDLYYLSIAKSASARSTCLNKQWGAVIVKYDQIIATGYNGAPRGRINCCDRGVCYRIEHKIPRGTHYEHCASVHAEANAIISASRSDMIGSKMYIYGYDVVRGSIVENADSCIMCKRMIINAGINEIIFATGGPTGYRVVNVKEWVELDDMKDPSEGY